MALSDDQRAMLRLLAQREQGYEDIAALMGLSVDEVRAQVARARSPSWKTKACRRRRCPPARAGREPAAEAPAEPQPPAPEPPRAEPSRRRRRRAPAPPPPLPPPPPAREVRRSQDLTARRSGDPRRAAAGACVVVVVADRAADRQRRRRRLRGLDHGGVGHRAGTPAKPRTPPRAIARTDQSRARTGRRQRRRRGRALRPGRKNRSPCRSKRRAGADRERPGLHDLARPVAAENAAARLDPGRRQSGRIGAQFEVPTEVLAYLANETFDEIVDHPVDTTR